MITEANHYLRGRDVVFELSTVRGTELLVRPRDAYLYNVKNLVSVAIAVHSAKNDWQGEGHRMYFKANDTALDYVFDLAPDMFRWAQEARPSDDDSFLMHRGKNMLSYDHMTKAIKEIAQAFGFDPTRFSMHSLRIGGGQL